MYFFIVGVSCCTCHHVASICNPDSNALFVECPKNVLSLSVPIVMDNIQIPSPVPLDGSFAKPFTAGYLLAGSQPGTARSSATSHSVGAHQWQMV